jgi:flagellar export protein FliJ
MKSFRFTLEAVRTLRRRQEQIALEQYAQTLLARQQASDRLQAVERELNAGWREMRELLARGCSAARTSQTHDYHRSLDERRKECARVLGSAELRVNAAFQAVLSARQQREIVDKCFEKQKATHQRGRLMEEQKLLDELSGRRVASILSWNPTQALP